MAVIYDPVTGMPKQQGPGLTPIPGLPNLPNPPSGPGGVQFNAAFTAPPTSGFAGYSTTGGGDTFQQQGTGPYGNLQDDPLFRQLNADLSAQGIQDLAGAQAATRRGLVLFGEVPTLDDKFLPSSWVDEPTRQLAQQNTASGMSIVARLAKANKDAIRSYKNMLAARGALQSGELGHRAGEEDLRYRSAQYDARQQLTDYLAGIQSALANAERQRAGQRAAGAEAAAGRQPAPAAPPAAAPPAAPAPIPPRVAGQPNRVHSAANVIPGPPPTHVKQPPPPPPAPWKSWFG
jgi:hypothetical protein